MPPARRWRASWAPNCSHASTHARTSIPINLIALVTLSTPKQTIDESLLVEQLDCLAGLLRANTPFSDISVTDMSGRQMVEHVEKLGMIVRESHPFGDVLGHDAAHAVLMTWYRNNASHAFALPSLIACLLVNRRRRIRVSQLMQMVSAVYPYLQSELYLDSLDLEVEVGHWLDHLAAQGLIHRSDAEVGPPPVESNESYRLTLLAQIVMQMLERFFIAVGLLQQAGQHSIDRRTLESDCIALARRVSRLYGLNAPEFFDARLFHNFVETLIARGAVAIDADGKLAYGRRDRRSDARIERRAAHGVSIGGVARSRAARTVGSSVDGRRTSVDVEPNAASENLPVGSTDRGIVSPALHDDATRQRDRCGDDRRQIVVRRTDQVAQHLRRLARQRVLVARGKHRIEIDRVEPRRFRQYVAYVRKTMCSRTDDFDPHRDVSYRVREQLGEKPVALHHQHIAAQCRERHSVETQARHAVENTQPRTHAARFCQSELASLSKAPLQVVDAQADAAGVVTRTQFETIVHAQQPVGIVANGVNDSHGENRPAIRRVRRSAR